MKRYDYLETTFCYYCDMDLGIGGNLEAHTAEHHPDVVAMGLHGSGFHNMADLFLARRKEKKTCCKD